MPRRSALAGGGGGGARAGRVRVGPTHTEPWARVVAWLELARWPNALIAAAGVALGAWWAGGALTRATSLAMVAAAGLTALANAYNDRRDAAIDAVAHPLRPIPSGRASGSDAALVAAAGGVVAVGAALLVSPAMATATAAVAGLMIVYSTWLKERGPVAGVAGNALVAALASLPFVFGAWSAGAPGGATLLYALAVPLHFAREIAKDLDDAAADAAAGRRTLPVTVGAEGARALLGGVSIVFAFGATAAFVRGGALGAALVAPALGCCAAAVTRARAGRPGAPRLLKVAMLLAMAGAVAARAGRLI